MGNCKMVKLAFLSFLVSVALAGFLQNDDDSKLQPCDLVNKRGLICEQHEIITSDGYILHAFRIPGRIDERQRSKPVVWLQHGIIDSSDSFIYNDDQNSLGTWLALQGYDVWLGNSRGNKYSDTHVSKTNEWNNADYWNFSWQEMGLHDVEANVDYALKISQQKKLVYVGHSQGTTQMFIALSDPSTRERLQDKIALYVALAPVIYLKHGWPVVRTIAAVRGGEIFQRLGIHVVFTQMPIVTDVMKMACNEVPILCKPVGYIFAQMDPDITNWSRTTVMITREPCGSSTRQFIHYEQDLRNDQFAKYDYGLVKNLAVYGTPSPPSWNLTDIKVPMVWYTGGKDVYANPVDTERAREIVQPKGYLKEIKLVPEFGHLGFMWSDVSNVTYFPDLLNNIKTYLPLQQ